MEQNKTLGLLSISRKGGNLVYGEETVGSVTRAGRARLVILAADASPHTVRRAKSFVAGTAQPLVTLEVDKDSLGDALGVSSCAIAAVTDVRLAQAIVKTLPQQERYEALNEDLSERVRRVEQRRAEEKAHRYNVRHGKK